MRRRRTAAAAVEGDSGRALSQVSPGVVGLAGLEPAPSSLSEMDGRAPCYPAFALVVRLRKSYKDGVNLSSRSGRQCCRSIRVVRSLAPRLSRSGQWVGHFPGPLEWEVVAASPPPQLDLPVALVTVMRRWVFRLRIGAVPRDVMAAGRVMGLPGGCGSPIGQGDPAWVNWGGGLADRRRCLAVGPAATSPGPSTACGGAVGEHHVPAAYGRPARAVR